MPPPRIHKSKKRAIRRKIRELWEIIKDYDGKYLDTSILETLQIEVQQFTMTTDDENQKKKKTTFEPYFFDPLPAEYLTEKHPLDPTYLEEPYSYFDSEPERPGCPTAQ